MSYDIVQEQIPPFTKRLGDWYAQGSNNALIVLGTDRAKKGPATINDGLGSIKSVNGGKGAGAALIVVGRKDTAGNPDLDKDSAYLYISMKTDGDKHLGTTMEGDSGQIAYSIMKSDGVRLVARKDVKIASDDGKNYFVLNKSSIVIKVGSSTITIQENKVVVDSKRIELGPGANQGAVLANQLKDVLTKLNQRLESHSHGPPGSPPVPGSPVIIPPLVSKRTFVDAG